MFFLLALLSIATATQWHELSAYRFQHYTKEFGKSYSTYEAKTRERIFEARLSAIRLHNQDPTKTWKQGVNQFTDKTDEELKAYLGARPGPKLNVVPVHVTAETLKDLDDDVDWRDQGVVTAVKDQGRCGSCWSFAAAETLESYYALASDNLVQLSQQQILDCTENPQHCGGSGGCGGGTVELAYAQIIKMGGLASEWTYPYLSYFGDANTCNTTRAVAVATITSYVNLPPNEQPPVINHLATQGPLAISVDASQWFTYETGVFDGCNQTNPDLDHAVQLVGYGTDDKLGPYWIVRNSWTPSWGEAGYIRLRREPDNAVRCGTDLTPGDGDGCSGGPPTEKVCGSCGLLYDAVYPVVSQS